jgi:uncharacterized protein (DUF433 family)
MKKASLLVLVVAVAVFFASASFAGDGKIEVKEKTTVHEGKEVTKIEAKDTETGAKVKVKERTTESGTTVTEDAKAPGVKIKGKEHVTDESLTGTAKVKIKKGAIRKLSVAYEYYQEGPDYILEYNLKDKTDPDLLAELNLTPEQLEAIKPGYHKVVSTSPFTAADIKADFQSVIIEDIKQAVEAKKQKKKK